MSQLDELVSAVAARVADPTVAFEAGRLRINEHAQRRKAIFVRDTGVLKPSAAPGRQVFGIPANGAGTTEFQRFTRAENIMLTLRAEDEDALDSLFDAVVNAIFDIGGPNVYTAESPYEWAGKDSQAAGQRLARNPEVVFNFQMRLVSHPALKPYAKIDNTQSTVTLAGNQVVLSGILSGLTSGYWWDRSVYSGLGTASFRIPERNGNTTFDRVQATLGAQPLRGPGYLRYPATLGHDSTAGAVAIGGSSTAVTIAMWWRFPNGITLTANRTNPLVAHYGNAGSRRMLLTGLVNPAGTIRQIRGIYSTDGSNVFQYFWQPLIDDQWHFSVWRIDTTAAGTLRMRYWQDLVEIAASAADSGGASIINASAVIESAGIASLGGAFTPDDLDISAEYFLQGTISDAQMAALMLHRNPKLLTPPQTLLVCDGDSITAGSTPATSYPGQLSALLFAAQPDQWVVKNDGHTGDTMAQMLTQYPANVRPYASAGSYLSRKLIVMEAYNAINGGATPAQVAADTAAYIAVARADGFQVIVGTALLSGDANSANLSAYNALVRANHIAWGAAGLIDFETTPGLVPAGNVANPSAYTDLVHPNTIGYGYMASRAFTQVTA